MASKRIHWRNIPKNILGNKTRILFLSNFKEAEGRFRGSQKSKYDLGYSLMLRGEEQQSANHQSDS